MVVREFDSVEGSWHFSDGGVIFHFLPGNRYLALQWEEGNGQQGLEYGTYNALDGQITFVTQVNNDGDALTCNEDKDVLCDGSDGVDPGVWGYSFNDEGQLVFSNEGGSFAFNKAVETDSPVDGLLVAQGTFIMSLIILKMRRMRLFSLVLTVFLVMTLSLN